MSSRMAKLAAREVRRGFRVRNAIRENSTNRFRICVRRSNRRTSAQLIDDTEGRAIAGMDTVKCVASGASSSNVEAAKSLGVALAGLAKSLGVDRVTFDRGIYRYHGRVAAVAEGLREGGLSL